MANDSASPSPLPQRPSIEYLRKLAKDRLDELRQNQPASRLADAQRDVAREHGFPSWRAIKKHIDDLLETRYQPFIAAIQGGDVAEVAAALDRDPSLIRTRLNAHNRTALHQAAWLGKTDVVRLLLDRGAEVNARDRGDNAYPIHFAAEMGFLDIVRMLVDAGAEVRGGGDTHGLGVIGWATCFNQVRTEVAEYLLSRGATHHIFSAVAMGDEASVRKLVDQDPTALTRPMSSFENHRTPLHLAVTKQQPGMIDLLLDLGADPHATDKNQQTPLQLALVKGDAESLERFENRGIELDQFTEENSPFSKAVPILNVRDVEASLDYYVDKLGFTKQWIWGDPVGFASVSRGEVTLFLIRGAQGQQGM
ncbi:MAG: ankyrin repeat domain-containing protein [Planctomycetota bacterium]